MLAKPFKKAKPIIETIESFHHEAYFVGGAIRDYLLNRTVNDIDLTTSAPPEQIQKMFNHVIPIGVEHGTVIVRHCDTSYEVTTYRKDNENKEDHSIITDLNYRDFTINAMAMDKNGNLIDVTNGKKDLANKIIRAVHSAKDRFSEDPLRIIRALRFVSELGFKIDKDTLYWMNQLKASIEDLAVERITAEMTAFFNGHYVNKAILYLIETKVYEHLPVFKEHRAVIEYIPTTFTPVESFGEIISLLHTIYPNVSINRWVKAWKCSNAIRKEAIQLTDALHYYKNYGIDLLLVYRLEPSYFKAFCRLLKMLYKENDVSVNQLTDMYNQLPIKSKKELKFTGNDLIKLFPQKKQGRWIREMLTKIEEQIILNNLDNNYDKIEEWVLCNPPEVN